MVERQLPKLHTGVRFPSPAHRTPNDSPVRRSRHSSIIHGDEKAVSTSDLKAVTNWEYSRLDAAKVLISAMQSKRGKQAFTDDPEWYAWTAPPHYPKANWRDLPESRRVLLRKMYFAGSAAAIVSFRDAQNSQIFEAFQAHPQKRLSEPILLKGCGSRVNVLIHLDPAPRVVTND